MPSGKTFGTNPTESLPPNLRGWTLSPKEAARRRAQALFASPVVNKVPYGTRYKNIRSHSLVNKMLNQNVNWPTKFQYSRPVSRAQMIVNDMLQKNRSAFGGNTSVERMFGTLPRNFDEITRRAVIDVFGNSIDYKTELRQKLMKEVPWDANYTIHTPTKTYDIYRPFLKDEWLLDFMNRRDRSIPATGKAHGMPFGFDPLDIREQIRLSQEALTRTKAHKGRRFQIAGRMHELDIERYQNLLEAGQSKISYSGDAYGFKGLEQGSLSIQAGIFDEFGGTTPGYGHPSPAQYRDEAQVLIDRIEQSDRPEREKSRLINRILERTESQISQPDWQKQGRLLDFIENDKIDLEPLEKWWGKYDRSRVPFYKDISYKSFRPDVASAFEGSTMYDRGFLHRLGIDMANIGSMEPGQLQDLAERLAAAEKKLYYSGERVLSLSRSPIQKGWLNLGRPSESGSRVFMSPMAQELLAQEMFGQTKVLRDIATGQIIPLGARDISEKVLKTTGGVTKKEYLDSIRALYFDAYKKGRMRDVEKFRKLIIDATVDDRAFNPLVNSREIKVNKRIKDIRREVKGNKDLAKAISVMRKEKKVTYRGFETVRDIVESSPLGHQFNIGYGRKAMVEPLERLEDVSLLLRGGKTVTTYGQHLKRTMNLNERLATAPDIFEAFIVREPFTKMPKVGPGGAATGTPTFYPYTTKVMLGPGKEIGQIPKGLEQLLGTEVGQEVAKGYIGKAYIRPYAYWEEYEYKGRKRLKKKYKLGVWRSAEESYETVHGVGGSYKAPIRADRLKPENTVTAAWLHESEIKNLLNNVNDDWQKVSTLEGIMKAQYPTMSVQEIYGKEAYQVWEDAARGIKRTQAGPARRLSRKSIIIGGAVAAGALMLWGASRTRNRGPITEREVSESLYGAPTDKQSNPTMMYTPQPRIVQQNTGNITNIDLEVTDDGRTSDHEAMARTMSAMSRSALGVSRVNTSMHIVDDSTKFSRESTRRNLNQQLRV